MVCNSCQIVGGHSCQRYSRKLWCSWWRSRQTRQVDITAMCCTIKWTDDTSCIHQHCRVRSLQATCPYSSHHFAAVAVSLKKLKWFIFKISSYGPNILKYSFEVLSGKQNRKWFLLLSEAQKQLLWCNSAGIICTNLNKSNQYVCSEEG